MAKINDDVNAKCKKCGQDLSAILSPIENHKVQLKRLSAGFCSKFCLGEETEKKGAGE